MLYLKSPAVVTSSSYYVLLRLILVMILLILQTENTDYITSDIDKLSPTDLHNIKSPFDYRCYVIGNVERKRLYMLGCGVS